MTLQHLATVEHDGAWASDVASRRPVRVCYVIDRLRVAGTETQLLHLIRGLDQTRVVPHLCLLDGSDELSQSLEPSGCRVVRLGVRSLHGWSTVAAARQFMRFLREQQIDVVQMHFRDSTYFAAPLARLVGVKQIVRTRRDLGFWMRPVDRWLTRFYNRLTTATIVNCGACREAVIAQERTPRESVTVLENGIDLTPLLAVPPVSETAGQPIRRVGMVANLHAVKGFDVFLRAAAIVSEQLPDVRFQLAGTGDEAMARRLMREGGIEHRCELRGTVRNVPAFLGELDVAVLASHSEGLSNALIEYMAAGRPTVATAVGGNVELLDDGVHGLLVPPGEPVALAAAMLRMLTHPTLAVQLGEAARRRAAERFSRAAMVRRHEDYYRRLVGAAPDGRAMENHG